MGFIHPDITFRAIQLSWCCRSYIFRISIVIRIGIMKTANRHYTFFRLFSKTMITGIQDSGNMRRRLIRIVELITCFIVEVGDIGIVWYTIIELDHRIFRLANIQFIKAFDVFAVRLILKVMRQAISSAKLTAIVHRIALRVYSTQTGIIPFFQVVTRSAQLQAGDTDITQRIAGNRQDFRKQGKAG